MGNICGQISAFQEIQQKVKDLEKNVASFSGLPCDTEYNKLKDALSNLQHEIATEDTEGKGNIQKIRRFAAKEVERLLNELEKTTKHP